MGFPLLFFIIKTSAAFLFDSPQTCWGPSPCTCAPISIACAGKGLNEVPIFPQSDREYRKLTVDLSNNMIGDLTNDSFAALDTTNATSLIIDLSNNHISHISDNAFDGIKSMVTELNLQDNNIEEIPTILAQLPNLQTLRLMGNPIATLNTPVIYALSKNLKTFSLSLDRFPTWPNEMHYFRQLSRLEIDGFQQTRLPLNAFSNIEKTLTYLEISKSQLDRIPSAVCHLDNLHHLAFFSNPKTSIPIFEPCSNDVSSVYYLSLKNNSLKSFPDVFNSFTNLDYLDCSNNMIRTVDENLIPTSNALTHLNISRNSLNRVPNAVNRLHHLKSLYLSNNMITSLEDYDLKNLTFLSSIYLDGNPLEYISDPAFQNQQALRALTLDNTRIKYIPRAVAFLTGLRRLQLSGTPIECTCTMDYLKPMNFNATMIEGTCEGTMEPLSVFLKDFLPFCP